MINLHIFVPLHSDLRRIKLTKTIEQPNAKPRDASKVKYIEKHYLPKLKICKIRKQNIIYCILFLNFVAYHCIMTHLVRLYFNLKQIMIIKRYISPLLIIAILLLIACTKEGNTIYQTNPDEEKPSTAPLVTVIYGPNSLGDRFSRNLVGHVSENPNGTYRDLYLYCAQHTLGSHVCIYNNVNFGNLYTTGSKDFFVKRNY